MLLGVLLLMIPESACIPVPSEITLMGAGFAVHQGAFGLPSAVAAGSAGNLVGSLIAYAVGRWVALPRRGRSIAARCDRIFDRYGSGAVFIGRLLPLVRSFVSLPAGHARVPIASFVAMTLVGCAIWCAAFVLAGEWAGAAWRDVAGTAAHVSLAVGGIAVLLVVLRGPLRS
jgi:membrane protein DedA with SNARE-associated domain